MKIWRMKKNDLHIKKIAVKKTKKNSRQTNEKNDEKLCFYIIEIADFYS